MSEGPLSEGPSGTSDSELTAMVQQSSRRGSSFAVADLFSRHSASLYRYAGLCTLRPAAAIELAKEAFLLVQREARDSEARPFAWRPRLLATVLACAGTWSRSERRTDLNSELLAWLDEPGNAEEAEAGGPPTLARRAYAELPEQTQCLLWHGVVEAESPAALGRLISQSEQAAAQHLEQARVLFREECIQAHLTRTVDRECLAYGRLIDAATRRGTADPGPRDLDRHLEDCAHCCAAAEELDQHGDRLALVLTSGLLAWGGRPYLDTRKTDDTRVVDRPRPVHRTEIRPATVAVAAGILSAVLLAVVGTVSHFAAPAETSSPEAAPASAHTLPDATTAPQAGKQLARIQLRNAGTGQCLDIRGGTPAAEADVISTRCASAAGQLWVFGDDALVHTAADPNLCPGATDDGSVVLQTCDQASGRGTKGLRLEWNEKGEISTSTSPDLALTSLPADGPGDVVLKIRDGSPAQIWLAKTPPPETFLTEPTAASTSRTEATRSSSPSQPPPPSPSPSSPRSSAPSPLPSVRVSVGPAEPDDWWGTAWPFVATATGFVPNQDVGFFHSITDYDCHSDWVVQASEPVKADSTGKAVWKDKLVYSGTRAAPPYTFFFCAVALNGSQSAKTRSVVD